MKPLIATFSHHRNPTIAAKQAAYMRNQFPFLGLPTPLRKQLQKPHFTPPPQNLEQTVLTLFQLPEREYAYAAIDLARKHSRLWTPHSLDTFTKLLHHQPWWDTVDLIAPNLIGTLIQQHPHLITTMDTWIDAAPLWLRRSALIFQLRWKQATDTDRLFTYCQKRAHEKEFFIQKAIGWVLREYSKTNPAAVAQFLQKNTLSSLSTREAKKYLKT